jgi:hypothetical protein
MQKLNPFEEACEILKRDPAALPDVSKLPVEERQATIDFYKLSTILRAANGPEYKKINKPTELKFFPWPDIVEDASKPSGFGLSCVAYGSTVTGADVGPRFCSVDAKTARRIFEENQALYESVWFIM